MKNPFLFRLGLFVNIPLASFTGVKLVQLDENNCTVTVPYKFLNKNPFKTTYWAVLGMCAELTSGLILMMYTYKQKVSISTFVVGCEARFIKRAVGKTKFVCENGLEIAEKIKNTATNFEAQEIKCLTNCYDEEGNLVAEFVFTWGVKARKRG